MNGQRFTIARNFVKEVDGFVSLCKAKPILAVNAVMAGIGSIATVYDVYRNHFTGPSAPSTNWRGSGRPLFGDAFQSLPSRILLYFVIVSALAWMFSLIAVYLTARQGRGWSIVSAFWFGLAGICTVSIVDLIFREVFAGNTFSILLFSMIAILLTVFLTKTQFSLAMETRSAIIDARSSGIMLLTLAACAVAFVSYLPLAG